MLACRGGSGELAYMYGSLMLKIAERQQRHYANLLATVQVGERQNHEKIFSVRWVARRSIENVRTLLR